MPALSAAPLVDSRQRAVSAVPARLARECRGKWLQRASDLLLFCSVLFRVHHMCLGGAVRGVGPEAASEGHKSCRRHRTGGVYQGAPHSAALWRAPPHRVDRHQRAPRRLVLRPRDRPQLLRIVEPRWWATWEDRGHVPWLRPVPVAALPRRVHLRHAPRAIDRAASHLDGRPARDAAIDIADRHDRHRPRGVYPSDVLLQSSGRGGFRGLEAHDAEHIGASDPPQRHGLPGASVRQGLGVSALPARTITRIGCGKGVALA
mmetsp:Transcript_85598/g.261844  ORF Transcript_85598/g.261844 Transcript_85598/m.261844 type:complete len:261 (+) Transcript_85598:399-1181(+)